MSDDVRLHSKRCPSEESAAREAQHLQALRGPGIVPVHGPDRRDLVLERAACSLADILHERGPLCDDEVMAVGSAAAAALARVHEAGLVHGDVKPANLLLSHGGELWLADFDGAAAADGRPLGRHSPPRLPAGTPSEPSADVAALALTLTELATGKLLDGRVAWTARDLQRLGCSAGLSALLAVMLRPASTAAGGTAASAAGVAKLFARDGGAALPSPVARTVEVDPTPTVDFVLTRPTPLHGPAPLQTGGARRTPRWWRRLAASWSRSVPTAGR